MIAPYFLRREKKDVLRQQGSEEEPSLCGAKSSGTDQSISRKNDLVVWLRLTELQQQIYKVRDQLRYCRLRCLDCLFRIPQVFISVFS
jgi:hypothetical protein